MHIDTAVLFFLIHLNPHHQLRTRRLAYLTRTSHNRATCSVAVFLTNYSLSLDASLLRRTTMLGQHCGPVSTWVPNPSPRLRSFTHQLRGWQGRCFRDPDADLTFCQFFRNSDLDIALPKVPTYSPLPYPRCPILYRVSQALQRDVVEPGDLNLGTLPYPR